MLLTLWCKEGVGQTFDYSNVQDIHVYPSSADEYNVSYTRLPAYSNNNIISCLGDFSTFYIRWYAADDNFNVTSWVSLGFDAQYNIWPFTKLADNSYVFYYPGTDLYGDAANLGNGSSNDPLVKYLLNIHVTSSSGVLNTFSDVVVCEVSDEAYNSSSENRVKIRVIYHFQEKKVEDNFSNVPSDISPIEKEFALYEALSPTSASIALNDATAPSYIRWYFADASGKAVANPGFNLTNGSYTYTSQGNSIYYGGTTTDTNDDLLNMTVAPQNGKSWSDLTSYKLVALLSNAEGTVTDGTLTQEPLIATKYEISFDYVTFASALPSNQHTLNIEVTEADAQTATISLSEQWEQIKSDLGAETVSYMKYYWLDEKTGSLTGSVSFSEHPLAGMHWLKPADISFSTDMLNFIASVTSGVITDYKLVILLSDEAATYDENSTWVKEPTLQSMYTVSFEYNDPRFDGALATTNVTRNIEKTISQGQTSVVLGSLFEDWSSNSNNIKGLFLDETPYYRRIYVRNKNSKEILSNQSDWVGYTDNYSSYSADIVIPVDDEKGGGELWTKKYLDLKYYSWLYNNKVYGLLLDAKITVPAGSSLTLEDIEVVCILSNEHPREEGSVNGAYTITLGPATHQVEYYFTFDDGVTTFPGGPKADAIDKTFTEQLTVNEATSPYALSLGSELDEDAITKLANTVYFRWEVTDANGNVVTDEVVDMAMHSNISANLHTFTEYGKVWYAGYTNPVATFNKEYLNVTLTPATGKKLTDYIYTCYIATDPLTNAVLDGEGEFTEEPDYDARYIFKLEQIAFENTVSATEYKTIDIYEEQSYTTISVDLGGTAPTYVRWYWSSDGNNNVAQTDWTFGNTAVAYSEYNGTMYHYAGTTPNEELNKLTITPPVGTDAKTLPLMGLKLIALVSTKTENDGAQTENGELIKEPLIDTKYIISFETVGFEGSVANAQFRGETIRLADDAMSSVTLSLPLSFVQDCMANEASSFYIRYYLTDKSGNRIALPDGVTITPTDNNITLTSNDYGHYWYSSTGIGSITELKVAVADANATVDLRDYNVVAVMSSKEPLEVSEGVVTYEPREMEVVYTYELKKPISNDFDGELASDGIRVQKLITYKEGTTSITLTDVRDDWDNLKDLFEPNSSYITNGANNNGAKTPRYRRVYVRNKQTGDILDWIVHVDGETFNLSENGHIWTAQYDMTKNPYNNYYLFFEAQNSKLLVSTISIPNGSSLNLSDIEVVFILAKGDAREESLDNWTITKGPEEHEVEYIFNFISEKYLPFIHYKGVTGREWVTVSSNPLLGTFENQAYDASTGETTIVTGDIRQGTHEWAYEIYVEPGAIKALSLPLQNVFSSGNQLEPQGYFRWYDWNTDFESANVKPYDENNTLLENRFYQKVGDKELSRGWIAWWWGNSQTNATANNVAAVNFIAPTDNSWTGDIIACDVSKYIDGLNIVTENYQTSINFIHEPTLSYRYKYIVRPASVIADAIDAAIAKGSVLENHGNVTIGIYSLETADGYGGSYWERGGTTTLRLERNSVSNYYFNVEGIGCLQSTSLEWSVYNAAGNKVADLSPETDNPTFCKLVYNSSLYRIGEFYSVKVYASANDTNGQKQSKEIARFNCKFLDNSYVMGFDDIPTSRTISYLEENYTRVGLISFDIEEGSTLEAPTNQLDNTNPMPFKWQRSHYGYCYGQLYESMAGQASSYAGLGALHGDYRLVKSANVVSKDMTELWHVGNVLHDRTYEATGGKQHGYFLYIDASDESRPIANVEFEGEMCVGSTLVLSAAVANMTDSSVKPQLIFKLYGIKTDINGNETERKLIHSFATCDFSTVKATGIAIWYQTYAKVTLQTNSGVENYQQFLVSIDNYCDGTNGADYAIDDIRIYTQNSKVEVKQNSVLCADEAEYTEADIMIKHETLLAMMPSVNASDYPLPVYYRICDENGNPLTGKDFYGAGMDKYGEVDFRYYFYDPQSSNADEKDMGTQTAEWLAQHYQKDVNGNRYFVLNEKDQTFKLEAGKKFYISLALPTEKTDDEGYEPDDYTWGKPTDVCSMYSDPFQPLVQSLKLTVGTNGINRINVDCHKTKTDNDFAIAGILQVPDPVTGELVNIDDPKACHFDWIVEVKGEESEAEKIKDALAAFRNKYGKKDDGITYYTTLPTEAPGEDVTEGFTKAHYETLQKAIADGRLYISASTDLVGPIYHAGNTYVITAIPLESKVTQSNGTTYDVCPEPMEVTVEARLNGPELNLGFEGIRYADAGLTYGADGLRVGQKQLQDMQSGKPLHLPINAYKQLEKNSVTGVEEYVEYTTYDLTLDDFDVIVWDSNDPTWTPYLCKDIDLYNTDGKPIYTLGKEAVKHITNENRSVELQLHQNYHKMMLTTKQVTDPEDGTTQNEIYVVSEDNSGIEIKYHEGYWYKVKFRYSLTSDLVDPNLKNRCYGESYLTIKVVPEYATWGEGLPNNSNWLNDANWRRSSKAELYKTVVNSDNYPVYDETTGLNNEKGYVPMSFTKVTILNDMQTPYPYLSELKRNVHTNLITEETLTNGDLSAATVNIQYDMMVGAEPTTCPYNKEKTNVYECEHFYGNICEQIYFKPRAQLRYQHYLDYEKAWVEMELSANKWMMLTSPFEQLYAGDFYVPAVEEGGAYPYGRQETEAFQDINFGDKSGESALYSRNGFPIYQRSWDKTNSMVVTAKDDALRDDYDAFIDYEWTEQITSEAEDAEGNITITTQKVMKDVDVVATQWSHVYNDMEKLYEPGRGFSIRLHHTDRQEENGTDTDGNTIYKDKKALLRFPKADTQYRYYDHADKEGHDITVDKSKHHRLAADGVATGMVQITPIKNADEDNPYYMVGNPYMASVRMELFFNANPHLVKTYWVVSNGAALSATEATGLGIIGPMQSFFVKTEDGQPVTNVLFSPAMTVSHLVSGAAEASETDDAETISFTTRATANVPMAQTRVVLSAEADNGFVDEEDVETLLDSNLEDVPMVYTVAGTQAAMVNRLNDVTLLPLGLFGAEGETVDVQVHGVDRFSQTLYFYDASTGKQTALEEGTALSLEANVHGRYFLTTRALEDDVVTDDTDWQVRAYSLQRGELIVAAMPQDNLRQVRIYGVNGHQVVNDATVQGHVATYALPSGIYVAEVITERLSRPQVVKVVVR